MATTPVTYTGTVAVDQETLGLHWEPGETQDLEQKIADRLIGPGSDFVGAPCAEPPASPSSSPPPAQTPAPPPAVGG